jgi:hypothetical protein
MHSLELARALRTEGLARYRLGEAQTTLTLASRLWQSPTELNDRDEMARCLTLMAASLYTLGSI